MEFMIAKRDIVGDDDDDYYEDSDGSWWYGPVSSKNDNLFDTSIFIYSCKIECRNYQMVYRGRHLFDSASVVLWWIHARSEKDEERLAASCISSGKIIELLISRTEEDQVASSTVST